MSLCARRCDVGATAMEVARVCWTLTRAAYGPLMRQASARWNRPLLGTLVVLLVAACGGPAVSADPSAASRDPAASDADGSEGGSSGNDGGGTTGGGSTDAPVIVTVDGTDYGFPIGTCEVSERVVRAEAGAEQEFAFADVSWAADGSIERFGVTNASETADPPAPFELYADANRLETTWEVEVDGTTAVIEARMANELPAAQGNPDAAFYDVTIRIRCDERSFGGMPPEPTEPDEPIGQEPVPTAAGESTVTLTLAGTPYDMSYPGCATDDAVGFVAIDADLNRLFVGGGAISFVLPDGTTWRAEGAELQVSGFTATWSGTMTSPAGSEQASISVEC
jgi:hypothetical protein